VLREGTVLCQVAPRPIEASTHARYARTEGRNWTELNWHGWVFDEMTNA